MGTRPSVYSMPVNTVKKYYHGQLEFYQADSTKHVFKY